MRKILFLAGALAAGNSLQPLYAKALVTEQFKAKTPIVFDPSIAYLLVRSPGVELDLLRVPTEADRKAFAEERAAALDKARQKYASQMKEYLTDVELYKYDLQIGKSAVPPEKPVEPTEKNFAYKSIDSDNFVSISGLRVFDSGGPRTVHLIAVPPGTYRLYGERVEAQGTIGFCLCMGSVQFDAPAGVITDMGTIHYPFADAAKDKVKPSWNGLTPGKGGLTQMRVEPAVSSSYFPASLAGFKHITADYRAAGKTDNYFGTMIERLTPLAGVLGYRRDDIVDERSATVVGSN